MKIEIIHPPPYYLHCNGKVEHIILTFNNEFLKVYSVFDNSIALISEFQGWYNDPRYHMGIFDFPNELYNNHFDVTYVP